jgi:hypothetical protein
VNNRQDLRRGLGALAWMAAWLTLVLWGRYAQLTVSWPYWLPMPATNNGAAIYFELWQSPDLRNWSVLTRTNKPPVVIPADSRCRFFKLRAYEVYQGFTNYSDWARNQ